MPQRFDAGRSRKSAVNTMSTTNLKSVPSPALRARNKAGEAMQDAIAEMMKQWKILIEQSEKLAIYCYRQMAKLWTRISIFRVSIKLSYNRTLPAWRRFDIREQAIIPRADPLIFLQRSNLRKSCQ